MAVLNRRSRPIHANLRSMDAVPDVNQNYDPARIDQHIRLHNVSWRDYEALLAMRGDNGGVRIAYLDGELELMTPSRDHESLKKMLARLIEAFAEERDIALEGIGSWTLKKSAKARGVEPDECYVVNLRAEAPEIPDIAIEVVWTSGGMNKLPIYQGLGIPEVWFWEDGTLTVYGLGEDGYVALPRSKKLPELDTDLLAQCMTHRSQTQAVKALRHVLREKRRADD